MSGSCNHNCSSCGSNCGERTEPQSFLIEPNKMSNIKQVIGVVSGKGGVGKSLVTSLLATHTQRKGYQAAILDADITGPSIPKAFGIMGKAGGSEQGILPVISKSGIEIMSINVLIENEKDPVIWRGPVIAGVVKQFWQDVVWEDVDYMFVDMPPGTGDVPLTVFQSLPLDGIVIVTSPQDLVGMVVEKAVRMAEKMNVPILGMVENMSYFECPDCKTRIEIFGESKVEEIAKSHKIDAIAKLPINPSFAKLVDQGAIESVVEGDISQILDKILT